MENFIVSAGHAGSTFISRCLNLHPNVCCINESHYLVTIFDKYGLAEIDTALMLQEVHKSVFSKRNPVILENIKALNIPESEYDNWKEILISRFNKITVKELYQSIKAFFLEKTGKSIYIDKTPCYGGYLGSLKQIFAHLNVVNISRDVVPSVNSMMKHPGFKLKLVNQVRSWPEVLTKGSLDRVDDFTSNRESLIAMAELWAYRTMSPLVYSDVPNLKYEDFDSDFEGQLSKLCDIFSIPYCADWLNECKGLMKYSERSVMDMLKDMEKDILMLPRVTETRMKLGYGVT